MALRSDWEDGEAESEEEGEEIDDDEEEEDESEEEEIDGDEDEEDESEVEEKKDDGDDEDEEISEDEKKEPEWNDFEALSLKECKDYLRLHGLRISGSKDVCIQRIKECRRIKTRNSPSLYPGLSFVIDCRGDVCKGDVIMFRQRVCRFNLANKTQIFLGMRTVAGRVVKESYGSAKQQLTFTVEVLWSRGTKRLSPFSNLLVKGRNLYKSCPVRQRWKNEDERLRVLSEKHSRGAAARAVRKLRKSKIEQYTNRQHHLNARSVVRGNPTWRYSKSGHMKFHNQNLPSQSVRHYFGSSSTMVSPLLLRPYVPDASLMPALQHWRVYHRNGFHRYQSNASCNIGRSNLNPEREFHQFPRVQRTGGFQHCHPGNARLDRHRNSALVHLFRFMLFSVIGSGIPIRS